jgi:hypothetical protein
MAAFGEFLHQVNDEIRDFVNKSWQDVGTQAVDDAHAFLEQADGDLRRWTQLLDKHLLTKHDFEFLLAAKKDVAALRELKRAGLVQVQLDRFMNAVVGAIINAAAKVFI